MASIGHVSANKNGGFKVSSRRFHSTPTSRPFATSTRLTRTSLTIASYLAGSKSARGNRRSETTGRDYVSLSLAAPEFGPRRLDDNLGRGAGGGEDSFALIWNPAD